MDKVSFEVTDAERKLIGEIAKRAASVYAKHKRGKPYTSREIESVRLDISLDLRATHASGCPLDLRRLRDADDLNLIHDIAGIANHLDRETGQLTGCFLPRFARMEAA